MDIQISAHYNNLDFILHVTDMDYSPAEPQTRNYPGCPAEAYATAGWVELDGEVHQITDITSEDMDVLVQLVNDNEQLFDTIVEGNDYVVEKLLEYVQQQKDDACEY